MKFTWINVVCIISYFIVLASSMENNEYNSETHPCEIERQGQLLLQPSIPRLRRHKCNKHFPSPRNKPSSRYDDMTPEERAEREERVNHLFARMMQFMTYISHVDNYLTDRASSVIKVMGRAIESEDEDEEADNYNRIRRHQ